jgi:hypothetical protein
VTWKAVDTFNGAPIAKYTIEYTSGGEAYADTARCVSPDGGNACETIVIDGDITRAECVAQNDATGTTCSFIGASLFPCTDNVGQPGTISGTSNACTRTDGDIKMCTNCATALSGDVLTMVSNTRFTAGDRVWLEDQVDGAVERPFGCMLNIATRDSNTQLTFQPGHGSLNSRARR